MCCCTFECYLFYDWEGKAEKSCAASSGANHELKVCRKDKEIKQSFEKMQGKFNTKDKRRMNVYEGNESKTEGGKD